MIDNLAFHSQCGTSVSLVVKERKPEARATLTFHSLDVGAELAQFLIEMFVAAVDMLNATDFGDAVRFQARQHERSGGAQIARHHWSAKEMIDALDDRSRALKIDMRAHPL